MLLWPGRGLLLKYPSLKEYNGGDAEETYR